MSDGTLLAYLSNRLGHSTENLATEALAYLLRTPAATRAMNAHAHRFQPDLEELSTFATQVHAVSDTGIPDLVGKTGAGEPRLVVEVKFGAGMTGNQPADYLTRLLGLNGPTLLLFLVPRRRVASIWAEVQRLCIEGRRELEVVSAEQPSGRHAAAVVAVTAWADLLEDIERGLSPAHDHRKALSELEQLRGLCEREDRELFQPFKGDFLGGSTGRHLLDLNALLIEAVDALAAERLAVTKGYSWSAGQGYWGKYFSVAGFQLYLQVNFRRWGTLAATPLFLKVYPGANIDVAETLAPLRQRTPTRLFDADGGLRVPIYLPEGADRDEVAREIHNQLREVCELLLARPAAEPTEPQPVPNEEQVDDLS